MHPLENSRFRWHSLARLFFIATASLGACSGCAFSGKLESGSAEMVDTSFDHHELAELGENDSGPVSLTVHDEVITEETVDGVITEEESAVLPTDDIVLEPIPAAESAGFGDTFPVDLPTVLQLAGGNSLQIALAAERVYEAYAKVDSANALWIPSLNGGLIYNRHNGRIQATEGNVLEVSRGSLFAGAGVGVGNSPLTGATGGPARMFVDLSLADVLFEPLAARQMVDVAVADQSSVFNDSLLGAGAVYLQLVRAQAEAEIHTEVVARLEELVKVTRDFADAGEGLPADSLRAQTALALQKQNKLKADETLQVASAELVRELHLDPTIRLAILETRPAAVAFIPEDRSLEELMAQGIAARPEVSRAEFHREATLTRTLQECWRPWLPHLYAGFSGGGFGGHGSSSIKSFSDRTDFDLAAIWELENLGFGNAARRRLWDSRHQQAHFEMEMAIDKVAAEVRQAYHRVQSRRQQIDSLQPQVELAMRALQLNLDGIRGGELRPIEALQAITALGATRVGHLHAVVDYNTAQLELLRAVGQPPVDLAVTGSGEPIADW